MQKICQNITLVMCSILFIIVFLFSLFYFVFTLKYITFARVTECKDSKNGRKRTPLRVNNCYSCGFAKCAGYSCQERQDEIATREGQCQAAQGAHRLCA